MKVSLNMKFPCAMATGLLCGLLLADTWTDPSTGLTWTYVLNGGEVSIGGGDYEATALASKPYTHVTIPSLINGHPVTAIGDFAFHCYYNMPSVEIPSGVKVIGRYAFSECYNLVPPKIPSTVVDIQEDAFDRCTAFETISIPSSVTNLGSGVFMSSGLTSIIIPDGVKSVGSQAFSFCDNLKMAYISKSVEKLDHGAFQQCYHLASVVIENGVKELGDDAFSMCYKLSAIEIPPSVVSIGYQCFDECEILASIKLHEGLSDIGAGAFSCCKELESITIPSTVTILKNEIFFGCDKLHTVNISPGVTTFWSYAFDHCNGLKTLIIPPSVKELSNSSFRCCPNLESIYFRGNAPDAPNGVFEEMSDSLVIYAPEGSTGWAGKGSTVLPTSWRGHAIVYGDPENAEKYTAYDVVFLNTVVPNQHWDVDKGYRLPRFKGWLSSEDGAVYGGGMPVKDLANPGEKVFMTAVWEFASPISDGKTDQVTAIVTEVAASGAIAVPETWANRYPDFRSKFGDDFSKAMMMESGKRDSEGKAMLVWQDYVAGTDPTNPDDRFTAVITLEGGKVKISASPELTEEEKAIRKYTVLGKCDIGDSGWSVVPSGAESNYRFFKLKVEMR